MYVVSTLERTGPTRQLLYLSSKARELGHEVCILTLSPEPESSLESAFRELDLEIVSLNFGRLKGLFFAKKRLSRLLIDRDIDVVHTQGIRSDLLVSRMGFGIKRIATLRNYPFEDYPPLYGKVRGWFMARAHIKALARFPHVAVVSQSIASALNSHKALKTEVLHNAVDAKYFRAPDKIERVKSRSEFSVSESTFVVVIVGDLIRRKRVPELLSVLTTLPFQLDILVVGDGPELEVCQRLVAGNKRVSFVGKHADVRPALWAADVFVSSSASEGMPNAVMEAMATGLPCVISDIPAHRELLGAAACDLPTVSLFDLEESSAQAPTQILRAFEAVEADSRSGSVRVSCDAFSVAHMAQRYCALYAQQGVM